MASSIDLPAVPSHSFRCCRSLSGCTAVCPHQASRKRHATSRSPPAIIPLSPVGTCTTPACYMCRWCWEGQRGKAWDELRRCALRGSCSGWVQPRDRATGESLFLSGLEWSKPFSPFPGPRSWGDLARYGRSISLLLFYSLLHISKLKPASRYRIAGYTPGPLSARPLK
jgi:hypothetical protein